MLKLPTPLYAVPSLGRTLGIDLWIKREDALDELGSGHKMRKLSHVLSTAIARKATVLVTAGSLPSSQTTAVAVAAARHALRAHVVYLGDEQRKPLFLDGPYLATCLAGPRLTWFERRPWREVEQALAEVCEAESGRGERPFVVSPGASEDGGLEGSIELGFELADQLIDAPTHIVAPVGSGGTALGIAVAAGRRGLPWAVHGACIASDLGSTGERIARLSARHRVEGAVELTDISLGGCYAATTPASLHLARELAVEHGVVLDPTYMLKAYEALRHLCDTGTIPRASKVVLVHTGGTWGALGASSSLAHHLREALPAWVSHGEAP